MRLIPLVIVVILLVMVYILGHHEWHNAIVTGMNDITSFFTGSK